VLVDCDYIPGGVKGVGKVKGNSIVAGVKEACRIHKAVFGSPMFYKILTGSLRFHKISKVALALSRVWKGMYDNLCHVYGACIPTRSACASE
jgi:hypothetical protein